MRKFFILPPIVIFLVSAINLIYGNYFYFSLWLMTAILVSLMSFPIAFNANDKDVPVFQVFAALIIIPIFFSIYAIMDLKQLEALNQVEVLLFGVLTGIGLLVLVMTLKGK
ncbi:MAG: hypothetical protein R6V40_01190 [Candidatus Moraniibacteriota bacterium]